MDGEGVEGKGNRGADFLSLGNGARAAGLLLGGQGGRCGIQMRLRGLDQDVSLETTRLAWRILQNSL